MSYVAVIDKWTPGEWRATPDQYERIVHEWTTGAPFLTFTTPEGTDMMLSTAEVIAVGFVSDAAIQAIKEKDARDALERP